MAQFVTVLHKIITGVTEYHALHGILEVRSKSQVPPTFEGKGWNRTWTPAGGAHGGYLQVCPFRPSPLAWMLRIMEASLLPHCTSTPHPDPSPIIFKGYSEFPHNNGCLPSPKQRAGTHISHPWASGLLCRRVIHRGGPGPAISKLRLFLES